MDIVSHLRQSLEDYYLSKSEKNTMKTLLGKEGLDDQTINFLRTKIIELANDNVSEKNYRLVMQWMKGVNNILQGSAVQQSVAFFSPGDAGRRALWSLIAKALINCGSKWPITTNCLSLIKPKFEWKYKTHINISSVLLAWFPGRH